MRPINTTEPQSLDSIDYDPIAHLNTIFTTPASLSVLPEVTMTLHSRQDALSLAIQSRAMARAASNKQNIERVQTAQAELTDLFRYIESVRSQAVETEGTLSSMMSDIKRLDTTKRNLTNSMSALKRLQMLTSAYEQLSSLVRVRQYNDCYHLLQAVTMLSAHFKSFRSIDQVAMLSRKISELQRELLESICTDFEQAFSKGEVMMRRNQLADGCLVIGALGDHARARLVNWYCNNQMREYRKIFQTDQESGSLDNISRRYAWFSRMLRVYDTDHVNIFPKEWKVDEALIRSFTDDTREDYKILLRQFNGVQEGPRLDVKLLLSCLQETLAFESSLSRRTSAGQLDRKSLDTVASHDEPLKLGVDTISSAFEPYMGLWIESQDRQLAEMINESRQSPLLNEDEEFTADSVCRSSTDLFHFYRLALNQCIRLSSSDGRLIDISRIFSKYLDLHLQQVLSRFLVERPGSPAPTTQAVLVVLNTAHYCQETTTQLESKIKTKLSAEARRHISFKPQADNFSRLLNNAVQLLVRRTDQACDMAWREMRQTVWGRVETAGDRSSFTIELTSQLKSQAIPIIKQIQKTPIGRLYCETLAEQVLSAFVHNISLCKPISETGAEQLLIDLYVVKTCLMELPKEIPPISPTLADIVAKRMGMSLSRLDDVLKTIQVMALPPDGLVQAYFIHIKDRSESNFRKILDLKGVVRRNDQATLFQSFTALANSDPYSSLPAHPQPFLAHFSTNPQLAPTNAATPTISISAAHPGTPSNGKEPGGMSATSSNSISSPLSHFLPSSPTMNPTLTAVLTAARESVDRFSSPPSVMSLGKGENPFGISAPTVSSGRVVSGSSSRLAQQSAGQSNTVSSQAGLDLKAFGDRFKSTFRIGKASGE